MNKKLSIISIFLIFLMLSAVPAFAADDHATMKSEDETIRHTTVDGYHLTYKLIDMREKMKAMGHDHSAQKMATHHLMLFIKDSGGQTVKNAKVGYLVTDTGTARETVMAMAMGHGYGSDITLAKQGEYAIKAKAVIGRKKIIDSFVYTLKN